jgi:hypothetical protein
MVDQRAKNMFATTWGNEGSGACKWYFIFYDNDTSNGINNEGAVVFNYDIEDTDTLGSGHVWNGWDSELWKLVKAVYADDIKAMYANMRSSGLLSYVNVAHILNTEQCAKWCEVIYNMDGQYKYIQPIVESGNASYLYALQGSRLEHRKWWLKNRFYYLDGKYNTGEFVSDFITMRLYTPALPSPPEGGDVVEPNADFDLTLFKDGYVRVKYGSYVLGQRANAGDTVHISAPAIQFNDTETIVYGVSSIQSLGSLAAKYAGTVDISQAHKITELLIGSDVVGYQNLNLTHVSVGTNTMLKTVDVRNCPNLTEPLDLSGCMNIKEVYAEGTGLSMVVLPDAGILETLHLPASIVNLTIKNQPLLTDAGLVMAGTNNISTLVLENMNNIAQWTLVKQLLAKNPLVLNRVRLIDIDVTDTDLNTVKALMLLLGVDENGMSVSQSVVTGKISVPTAYTSDIAAINLVFPELEIVAGSEIGDPVVTFEFYSNKGDTLTNTTFTCNKAFTQVNDHTFTVSTSMGSVIQFTFTADNHKAISASYEVFGTATQGYSAQYIPLVTIQFLDTSSVAVAGAVASIDGQDYVSDAQGKIYLHATGLVQGTVKNDNGEGKINVNSVGYNDQSFTVTVYPYVNYTRWVYYDGLGIAVPGVQVTLDGVPLQSNAIGEFTVKTFYGNYVEVITYGDGSTETIAIAIGTSDYVQYKAIAIPVDFDYTSIFPTQDGSVQFLVRPATTALTTISIMVNSTDSAYSVDWGDGSDPVPASGTGQKQYVSQVLKFNYQRQSRLVRILNCQNVTQAQGTTTTQILAYFSVGNSKIDFTVEPFDKCIYAVGSDLFKAGLVKNNISLNSKFYQTALRYVAPHIFDGLDLGDCSGLLLQTHYLSKIPSGLLATQNNVNRVLQIFNETGKLVAGGIELPANTFGDLSNVTYNTGMFASSGIKHIYESHLSVFASSQTFINCFDTMPKLETAVIPDNVIATSGYLFPSCPMLQWIEMKHTTPPNYGGLIFYGTTPSTAIIYVPDAVVDVYKAATGWSNYADRIKGVSERT